MAEINVMEDMSNCYKDYLDYCNKLEVEKITECPMCNLRISPNMLGEVNAEYLYVLLQCPDCKELFIAKYRKDYNSSYYAGYKGEFISIFPKKSKTIEIYEKISEISNMFLTIYNQSLSAEDNNLDQIAGIGYRKALEFLIKDYLKYRKPNEKEEIEKKLLGKCIEMIDNVNIKKMAKGATWLGNDETHYVKKWENKDITDLKNLIDLTLAWIGLELKTEEYTNDMNL